MERPTRPTILFTELLQLTFSFFASNYFLNAGLFFVFCWSPNRYVQYQYDERFYFVLFFGLFFWFSFNLLTTGKRINQAYLERVAAYQLSLKEWYQSIAGKIDQFPRRPRTILDYDSVWFIVTFFCCWATMFFGQYYVGFLSPFGRYNGQDDAHQSLYTYFPLFAMICTIVVMSLFTWCHFRVRANRTLLDVYQLALERFAEQEKLILNVAVGRHQTNVRVTLEDSTVRHQEDVSVCAYEVQEGLIPFI